MAGKKNALGTGLGVLFGEDSFSPDEIITLPLSRLEPRKEQPREYFDEEALAALSESIKRHGLLQPISVRSFGSGYQIIAGERRWRAAKMAGLEEVPVRIIEADDRAVAELALVENLQREDLNPVEEAKGYKSLMEEYELTQEEVAESVGKSRPAVANALRLLNLGEEILKMVETGSLSAGHARALIPITDEELRKKTARDIIEKNLSVRKTEALVAKLLSPEKDPEKPEKEIDYGKEISRELSEMLGRRVQLRASGKNGKIELEYYGSEDRENLISQLKKMR